MSFRNPLVIYFSIPNRAKEKLEGERSQLFTRFTVRDVTQLKINHHCPYHTDQEKHLTACSRLILEYLEAFCLPKRIRNVLQVSCGDAACAVLQQRLEHWGDLLPAWHCPVAPQGSRAETNTAGTTHLPCWSFVRGAVLPSGSI